MLYLVIALLEGFFIEKAFRNIFNNVLSLIINNSKQISLKKYHCECTGGWVIGFLVIFLPLAVMILLTCITEQAEKALIPLTLPQFAW